MKNAVFVGLLLATSALGVARIQPHLASKLHDVKLRDDVYLLPPPNELLRMTLGYHAAAADAVWAKLIVEYGTHWQEKRPFAEAPRYLDAILALEPTYPPVYKYADTLIVYRPPRGTEEDWYTAKTYLERGTRERPWDHEVWLHYGQFLAFMSLTFVSDKQELEKFRLEGAKAIVRAVELGADPDRSISAATLLTKYGERDAGIREALRNLHVAYAMTEDLTEQAEIEMKIRQLEALSDSQAIAEEEARRKEMADRRKRTIDGRRQRDYPFLSRDAYLLLWPHQDAAACAGRARRDERECAQTWEDALGSRP